MPPEGFEPATPKASGRTPTPYTARPLGSPPPFPDFVIKIFIPFFIIFLPTRTAQAYHKVKITVLST